MIRHLVVFAAMFAAPLAAQESVSPPPQTLEQAMLLRCSAVFAVVAGEQQRGVVSAQSFPPLAVKGREYFVRAGARLMDELHLSQEQIAARMREEIAAFQTNARQAKDPAAYVDSVMDPCLASLDASGL